MRMRTNGCVFMSTFRTGSSRARYEKHLRRVFGVKENRNVSAKQNTQQSFVRERERENGEENFPLRGWQWRFCRCVGAGGAVVVLLFASSEKMRRRTSIMCREKKRTRRGMMMMRIVRWDEF